jgi:PAS domain S-box-containing protein
MSNDISEKKQAEEQLRQASQYARSLIEASLDPLVTISPEGKITDVNEATMKVTGIFRDKLIGTDFSDYFTEPEDARKGCEQVFAKGFVTDYPLTIRHKDGRFTDSSTTHRCTGMWRETFSASLPLPVTSPLREKPRRRSPNSGPEKRRGPGSSIGWRSWSGFRSLRSDGSSR